MPEVFKTGNGGNGLCHCAHLDMLDRRVPGASALGSTFQPGAESHCASGAAPLIGTADGPFDASKPIKARGIGVLASDKPGLSIFNGELTESDEFRFDGFFV